MQMLRGPIKLSVVAALCAATLFLSISCALKSLSTRRAEAEASTYIVSSCWFRETGGLNENGVFVWNIEEVLAGKKPELRLLWRGGEGGIPEARISWDGRHIVVATWNPQRDAQNILLIDPGKNSEEWLTSDAAEQRCLSWLDDRRLLCLRLPHDRTPVRLQVWDVARRRLVREFSLPGMERCAVPQVSPNVVTLLVWKDGRPHSIALLDPSSFAVRGTYTYPFAAALPVPVDSQFIVDEKKRFFFVINAEDPESPLGNPERTAIYMAMPDDQQYELMPRLLVALPEEGGRHGSLCVWRDRYLIFTEVSRKELAAASFTVNVLDLETGRRHQFVPEWEGKKVLLINHALITRKAASELGLP